MEYKQIVLSACHQAKIERDRQVRRYREQHHPRFYEVLSERLGIPLGEAMVLCVDFGLNEETGVKNDNE
jgi:hypothetical protein